jgi:hypothetical protein
MAGSAASSKVVSVFLLLGFVILLYIASPYVLPTWRWLHVDFEKIAAQQKEPEAQLRQLYDVQLWYHPRGPTDPCPWQIVSMSPAWNSLDDKRDDEDHVLIRCTFICEGDGKSISSLWLGSGNYRDRFWRAKVWRFPPGSFGFNSKRPVLVWKLRSNEKLDFGTCEVLDANMRHVGSETWDNDDTSIDDGFGKSPPGE